MPDRGNDGEAETSVSEAFDPALADGAFQVLDRGGVRHLLPGLDGFRLMEIMRECGVEMPENCGGAVACGTCHVYVDPDWFARLVPAREDEEAMLDQLLHARPNSRLSCQILWEAALDGLRLMLAPPEG
ncbi:MAG: 2Fe-2S iron-sulfur cluster binding domain-containing protein [Methylobacterium sp.]|jgi:2Fe-2S ferredoxin|nr:2Fe-2S iron-sulfur cluster binding domain-containing protein [Methylobacterium sp.]